MMDGWIKLHRCLIDKAIWKRSQPEQKTVLITILCIANHEPNEWVWDGKKYIVESGQFITSLESLAKKSGVSIRSVRTALANFEKLEFLTSKSTKTGRLITVVNWALYQHQENKSTNKSTNDRQRTDKEPTTNKNDKNDKKKTFSSDSDEFRLAELLFDLIRQRNPEHKAPDLQAWSRHVDLMLRVDGRSPERIAEVIRWATRDSFWSRNILSTAKLREKFDALVMKMGDAPKSRIDRSHLAAV